MKVRLLAAAPLIPVLFIIVFSAPKVLLAIIVGLICAIASYELLAVTGLVKNKRLIAYTAAIAFAVPLWSHFDVPVIWTQVCILVFFALLFAEILASHGVIRFDCIAVCVTSGLLMPYLLSALVRLMDMDNGRFLVFIPFVTACLADAGAYFIGKKWGKHKFVPNISANKSSEGVIGGVACSVIGMVIYCLILQFAFSFRVNYIFALIYGIVCAFAGVFGDLCFSVIKRQTGIKDFGNLIPGHGGILDRFDSMMVVAPLVELLLAFLPVVEKVV